MSRQRAVEILETDRALTGRQLFHYYGVHPKLLTGLGRREVTLSPKHGWRGRPITVQFYGLRQSDLDRLRVTDLRHFAGTGAMRYQLEIPVAHWSVLNRGRTVYQTRGRRMDADCVPDAEYVGAAGLIAVEFDTGTYVSTLVEEKLRSFDGRYRGTVWGTLSGARQARLKSKVIDWGVEVKFLDATWWTH